MKFPILILFLVLTACKQIDTLKKANDFTIQMSFEQSFATPIELQITKSGTRGNAIFKLLTFDSVPPSIVSIDTAWLTDIELQNFLKQVEGVPLFSLLSDTSLSIGYTDGQTTRITVIQGERRHQFAFNYPSRKIGRHYYRLLDAAFDLMYHHFNKYEAAIEQNQEKLDYGLAVKQSGSDPIIVRMYGTYHRDPKAAQNYLYNLPQDRNVIIDFSNLGTLTFIIDALTQIEKTHSRLAWVVGEAKSDWAIRQIMIGRGMDSTRMFRDTMSATRWLNQKNGG